MIVTTTINRPTDIRYGCRIGMYVNDMSGYGYIDDYDISNICVLKMDTGMCGVESKSYNASTDTTTLEFYPCTTGSSSITSISSITFFVLYNSSTFNVGGLNRIMTDGSSINSGYSGVTQKHKIFDGKIMNETNVGIDINLTSKYSPILSDAYLSSRAYDTLLINTITFGSDVLKSKNTVSLNYNDISLTSNADVLPLKFLIYDGNNMLITNMDDESNKIDNSDPLKILIKSGNFDYEERELSNNIFNYVSGIPDTYVPKFNFRWYQNDAYNSGFSHFGCYIKDINDNYVCISTPTSWIGQLPFVDFPIELYANKNSYQTDSDGNVIVYLLKYIGSGIDQQIFKTNLINKVTNFIKTY